MPKVLIVTNDFPPRSGGIQSFVHALASRLPAGQVVVYAPAWQGAAEFDARQPFPVVRHPTSLMLPVPVRGQASTRDPDRARLRHRAVRCGSAAWPARARAAQGGRAPDRRPDARSRGRLGGAAWRASLVAADRRARGRADLPGGVLSGSGWPGRSHRGRPGGWSGWRRAWTTSRSVLGAAAPRSGSATGYRRGAGGPVRLADGAAQGTGHADPGVADGTRRAAGDAVAAGPAARRGRSLRA